MKRIIFLCVAFVLASFALQDNNCDERIQILEDKLERLMTRLENMRDDRRDDIMSPMMSPKDHLFFNPSPWGYINAADAPFNATGDGKTDNTRSIQMALDYAASNGGGTVFLPVGTYLVNGNLRIGPYVSLKGSSDTPLRSYGTATTVAGTTLLAIAGSGTSSGTPFVFMTGPDTTIEGLSIFYPNQIAKNPPISFPFCISGTGDNLSVKNVLLVNPYQGIDFATESCPRHLIENVYGQPLLTGVQVDQCYDIGRIRHVHFWPFWTWNTDFGNWMGANAVTFRFMRSDWEIVEDVFSWGYNTGMLFSQSSHGALNGQFTNINFDNVDVGIHLIATQPYGVFFSNLNLANAGQGTRHISILGDSGSSTAVFRGISIWGEVIAPVMWNSSGLISISDSLFVQWKKGNTAVTINSGRSIIRGNYFSDLIGNSMYIGSDVDRAVVTSNELVGNPIVNHCKDVVIADNHL